MFFSLKIKYCKEICQRKNTAPGDRSKKSAIRIYPKSSHNSLKNHMQTDP